MKATPEQITLTRQSGEGYQELRSYAKHGAALVACAADAQAHATCPDPEEVERLRNALVLAEAELAWQHDRGAPTRHGWGELAIVRAALQEDANHA